jgi:hypothetical protein
MVTLSLIFNVRNITSYKAVVFCFMLSHCMSVYDGTMIFVSVTQVAGERQEILTHKRPQVSARCLKLHTAIPIIIEGQFQVFQRFSRSKMVLKAVESCFVALNYYGNGSTYTRLFTVPNLGLWFSFFLSLYDLFSD